ncbi:MAG TPA: hypothetical protein VI282_01405, partial [Verrucomicrobiae bacterium]
MPARHDGKGRRVTLLASDREAGKFTFRFEQAEREWFRHILDLYPVQQAALKQDDGGVNEDLEKALAGERKKLREDAELFLKAGKLEIDAAFNEFWDLTLTASEIEELLQILNNVRVGLWIRMGKPEPSVEELMPKGPSEEQVRAH